MAERDTSEHTPNLQGISVLILEDDLSSVGAFQKELRSDGAQVNTVRTLRDALTVLSQGHVRVILAAINFVDEAFIATVRDYKTQYPDCLFYVLTEPEYDNIEVTSETVKLFVDDYDVFSEVLNKPKIVRCGYEVIPLIAKDD